MGFFFGNKRDNVKWEDTKEGQEFYQKALENAIKRRAEKEEWERTVPQEKKEQVKLFKIIIVPCTFIFVIALYIGFLKMKELYVLGTEALIALICFILWKVKPKKIKYPNCFMMPVITFGFVLLLTPWFYFDVGKPVRDTYRKQIEEYAEENQIEIEQSDESYLDFIISNKSDYKRSR